MAFQIKWLTEKEINRTELISLIIIAIIFEAAFVKISKLMATFFLLPFQIYSLFQILFAFIILITTLCIYLYIRDNLQKEIMPNIESFGQRISKYSIALLGVAVPFVGLTSIAGSFFLQNSFLIVEAAHIFSAMFSILVLLLIMSVIATLVVWSGKVIKEYQSLKRKNIIKEHKKRISRRYAYASLFVLFEVSLLIIICLGGVALFRIPLYKSSGVILDLVVENSPAAIGGLKEQYVIDKLDSTAIYTYSDFSDFMKKTRPNQTILVELNNKTKLNVTLSASIRRPGQGFLGVIPRTYLQKRSSAE